MSTPFATATDVIAASGAQISFIESLFQSRAWSSDANVTYARRASIIAAAISSIRVHGFELTGEAVNDHLTSDEYDVLTKAGASKLIDWLQSLPELARTDVASFMSDSVPAGRYAIDTQIHAVNGTAFYRVDRPTEGKWAGRVFVKQIIGPDEQRLSQKQGSVIIRRIAEAGAEAASARYGHEIGECGVCGRRLTNDESRARGIGPVCVENMGW